MRTDELRHELSEIANDQHVADGSASAVVARGKRRLLRRRLGVGFVALAVVGASVGVAVSTQHTSHRGVVITNPPTSASTGPPILPKHEPGANQVLFTSASEGWICADRLLHTADGGQTWQSDSYAALASGTHTCAAVPTDAWIAVQATDGHTTLLPAQGGPDVGVTGAFPALPAGAVVEQLTFVDKNDGWLLAVGDHGDADHGLLYRTTTGSSRMDFALVSSDAPTRGVQFANPNDGWGIAASGLVRTTDGGSTWWRVTMPPPVGEELGPGIDRIVLHGANILVEGRTFSGNLSRAFVLVGTDGGTTWTEHAGPPTTIDATEATMFDAPDGTHWRLAFGNEMWITDDGGSSWTKRAIPFVVSIAFPSPDMGWATNLNGDVVRTTDAGRSWHAVDTTPQPSWSSVLVSVPTGCPVASVVDPPANTDDKKEALRAAEDFVLRTRGWTGEEVQAIYPVTEPGGQFGVVFSTNVPRFCGAKVAALSYGVELHNSSITQDTSRITSLVVSHFADGWKVWGFYK